MDEAEKLWTSCREAMRAQVPASTWNLCFAPTRAISITPDELRVAVPNRQVHDRIHDLWHRDLESILTEVGGIYRTLVLEVRPEADGGEDDTLWQSQIDRLDPDRRNPARKHHYRPIAPPGAALNDRYTFDAFVIGTSNRFSHAAALSVAETPGRSYNPLFIAGGVGLGKTHLLHAIGHYVKANFPNYQICYVPTETFLNDFVEAIRTNTTAALKRRYRTNDVLLIDDVQFIEGKEGFQVEFFHTFDELYRNNKQIVISCDRLPREMPTIPDRLLSRFQWGLVSDVQPPDLETRLAILRKKAEREPSVIDPLVLEFIATHVTSNIRELEGAFNQVTAYASLNHIPLTRELADQVLADVISDAQPRSITAEIVIDASVKLFNLTRDEITGQSRRRPLVIARQIGMYVLRQLTNMSYPSIAQAYGGRDHTTVIHAVERITQLMKEQKSVYNDVVTLTQAVQAH